LGPNALLVIATLALATGLLAYVSSAFGVDSWLALAAGREIWQNGLPHHETFTVIAHGVTWVDQQWLSQLASYGLYRLGGLGLLGLANVALIIGGVAGAVASARRLGARPQTMMMLMPLCVWLVVPAREVRTQEFVIPLFVATVYLLARDSRTPSRRVYWCLPILVLWGNLHGSATLGAGLVSLRGLTLAWEHRAALKRLPARALKPIVLALGAPACLLLTPYGVQILPYYHATLFNSALRHSVTEWQPITSSMLIAGPFFLLAGITLWSFGRRPSATTMWERLALIALAAVSITVIRNAAFFGLCALALVPVSLEGSVASGAGAKSPIRPRVNAVLSAVASIALVAAIVATLTRPAATFEASYQRVRVLSVVQAMTRSDARLKVLADLRFADWLLWRDPQLRGRLAEDARFELLSGRQINRQQRTFEALGSDWKAGASGYRLVVLDTQSDRESVAGFLAERGRRVLYDDGQRIVILRSAAEAA
jgi:hypothetical protein